MCCERLFVLCVSDRPCNEKSVIAVYAKLALNSCVSVRLYSTDNCLGALVSVEKSEGGQAVQHCQWPARRRTHARAASWKAALDGAGAEIHFLKNKSMGRNSILKY